MSQPTRAVRSSIAIIGAGAAGTLTAARLIDEAGRRRRPLDVTIIDPRATLGAGVAYGTDDSRHLLNVPVRKMSAYPDDVEHFARWLEDTDGNSADPCEFVPRGRYGRYLAHVLDDALRRTPWVRLFHIRDRAVELTHEGRRCMVRLSSGAHAEVDAVVVAIGHLGPDVAWAPDSLRESGRFVSDPWDSSQLDGVEPTADVLIVGTGLTMVDTVRVLDRPRRVIHAISRHGLMPAPHRPGFGPVMEAPEFASAQPTLAELRGVMTGHVAKAVARYDDWRPAVDSVRAVTQRLWAGLDDADRQEFLACDARQWDTHRHRIPPDAAASIEEIRRADRLRVASAGVVTVVETVAGLEVTLSDGRVLQVGAVVNCAGPCGRPTASADPLVRSLVEAGLARSGPLGIGFDTDVNGRLRNRDGSTKAPIWTLGSLRRGSLWESTAIPEIRDQAAALADQVLGPKAGRDHRPRDRYGLVLSTTREAADLWIDAMHAMSTLRCGAAESLRAAVQADPGFALGHAALALVGHEWGAAVDVNGSLAAAVDSSAFRGDARERSFVQAVASRLTAAPRAGDHDLTRHLGDYPLDALAASVALPTIAFSGLNQPVTQSWALADRLALSYGDDWWFSGMLAFVRQEQQRWDDAERLSTRSLREVPDSGHAAHARTHVFYETGDHVGGLAWLDGWIGAHARDSDYGAHFSWHAALHELALDRGSAARERFSAQLGPSQVSGARALVDSVSLLWRSTIAGCPPDQPLIDELLTTVPSCLLHHPATPFAAMHAVVAHAASGNLAAMSRLRAFAASYSDPTYPEVIVPLCDGYAAHVAGDAATAAEQLAAVVPASHRLGGSVAQQEVIEETLIRALIDSGQHGRAGQLLTERLDRRPRPSDARTLSALQSALPQ